LGAPGGIRPKTENIAATEQRGKEIKISDCFYRCWNKKTSGKHPVNRKICFGVPGRREPYRREQVRGMEDERISGSEGWPVIHRFPVEV
jgi:hypothetical protein